MTQPPDRHDPDDIDRQFREIVEGLGGPRPDTPSAPEGTTEAPGGRPTTGSEQPQTRPGAGPEQPQTRPGGAGAGPEQRQTRSGGADPVRHLGPGTPEGMATDHRSYEPPENEDDDHFVPPPPPPLPAGDLHFWAIVGGLVLGPLLVALSAVLPLLDRVWTPVGVLLTLAGFVLLVLRLPRHRGDGDWGARV